MKFKDWVKDYEKAFAQSTIENIKKQGIKLEGHTIIRPNMFDDQSLQLYNTYRIDRTNKMLVRATWGVSDCDNCSIGLNYLSSIL